jgi:6-phosphogluconolactonase
MTTVRWHDVVDARALRAAALRRILTAARRAIGEKGRFRIVLSGGETPRELYGALRTAETDWAAWEIYFGDERCVPPDDSSRNSRMAAAEWLDHVRVPATQVHRIPGELGASEAAALYARVLEGVGEFDFVLLGLGEDGHTAALFPGHEWGEQSSSPEVLAVFDAPKPPPERVSLSAGRLSRAREVLFLVEGPGKRGAVTRWRAGERLPAPASSIRPPNGVDVLMTRDGVERARLTPGAGSSS